jgi:hypothetical protein
VWLLRRALAAVRSAPLPLVGVLVVLLGIPWGVAATRQTIGGDAPSG